MVRADRAKQGWRAALTPVRRPRRDGGGRGRAGSPPIAGAGPGRPAAGVSLGDGRDGGVGAQVLDGRVLRRRACGDVVQVSVRDGYPVQVRHGARRYCVDAERKVLVVRRPGVDIEFWHVAVSDESGARYLADLRREDGRWWLAGIWTIERG